MFQVTLLTLPSAAFTCAITVAVSPIGAEIVESLPLLSLTIAVVVPVGCPTAMITLYSDDPAPTVAVTVFCASGVVPSLARAIAVTDTDEVQPVGVTVAAMLPSASVRPLVGLTLPQEGVKVTSMFGAGAYWPLPAGTSTFTSRLAGPDICAGKVVYIFANTQRSGPRIAVRSCACA